MYKIGGQAQFFAKEISLFPELMEYTTYLLSKMFNTSESTAKRARNIYLEFKGSGFETYEEFEKHYFMSNDSETYKQIEQCKSVLERQAKEKKFPLPLDVIYAKAFLKEFKV